jgi:hypothetical protein
MTVKIPVPLTAEEEAKLLAQAKAEGVSVDALLRRAVLQIIAAAPNIEGETLDGEMWEKEFEQWLDSLPTLPPLSDEAISRESIYTREDEWR